MDIATITSMIGSLGFPICMCVVLFWYLMKESENHKEEMATLKESLDNNTAIITKLYEKIGGGDE